jgi:hypothetical protein
MSRITVIVLLALAGCAPPPVLTGQVLSSGNEDGQDEDPSLLRAADGQLAVAWYSNRNSGDKELFFSRSTDGQAWSDPVQLTRSEGDAFYPSLAQDQAGTFHVAWWSVIHISALGTNNKIFAKSSPDGATWDLDQETIVAGGPGDFVPCMVHDRVASRLLVFFASSTRGADGRVDLDERTLRLYVSENAGSGWGLPKRLNGANDDATHNTFPFVVQRADGTFLMVWTRYSASASSDVLTVISDPSTETMMSTSPNGVDWDAPALVSEGAGTAVDALPSLYPDFTRASWTALWVTAAKGSSSGATVEASLAGPLPAAATTRPELTGYSSRVEPLDDAGRYIGVWVAGASGRQKIRFDVFTK